MFLATNWMIGNMDLNASPLPEDDEDTFEPHFEEDNAPAKHIQHISQVEHVESSVDILHRVLF